jgi:MFS family permease
MSAALAPLHHRPFGHLFIGTTANLLGNGVAPIALAFAVLDATGSVGSLGLVVGAHSLTSILFLLYGGVLADRLPRGPLLVGSSVV